MYVSSSCPIKIKSDWNCAIGAQFPAFGSAASNMSHGEYHCLILGSVPKRPSKTWKWKAVPDTARKQAEKATSAIHLVIYNGGMATSLFFSGLTIVMLRGDGCLMGFQASEIQETAVRIHADVMCT
ncbi:hypothetical protein QQF64_023472 [Cirrhinus molitorella]|uniref:Uncharacterized protein n=1 Tax=Cirrhinus molitorella TaxID=172907 RepID=A0ABR3L7W6_9TELE